MKAIYSVTYQVIGEEINSLGLFNSMDEAKDAIALHECGGSFDDYSSADIEELVSDINNQLSMIYYNEGMFYSDGDVEYHVHEWHFDDDCTIENDMFEVVHLEVIPCDEIHESIGLTHSLSCCSKIILGFEEMRRANIDEDLSDEEKLNMVSVIDEVIAENGQILFDEGDVCYCIVTHKFSNEK